ncbi:MAG: LPXTG cell wall anchor domain-containing protein [Acetatifactor sp.]|nr:LPXTG cell wall anchor domain-containing protein [Acetatifactor sp.]
MKKTVLIALAIALGLLMVPGVANEKLIATATENNTVVEEEDADVEEEDTGDVVVSASGETVASSIATSNTSSTQVALTTPSGTLNAVAGVPSGQSALLHVENSQCGPLARQAVNNAAISAGGTVVSILELDLQILNTKGIWEGEKVTTLSAPVEFKISAPEGVDGNTNDFAMVRLHDGVTTILPDQDDDPATITFTTDRFSVYAVIAAPKGTFKAYRAASTKVKDSVPKTGDSLPIALPLAAAACLTASVVIFRKKSV